MIIIHGELEIGADSDAAFLPLAERLVTQTRAEQGCSCYAFARDLDNPALYRIVEEWDDEQSLADHMKSDHYRAFGRALRDLDVKRMSLVQYTGSDRTVLA